MLTLKPVASHVGCATREEWASARKCVAPALHRQSHDTATSAAARDVSGSARVT